MWKGGRLYKTNRTAKTVHAFLTVEIVYNKDGNEIKVPRNTAILVDIDKGVALIGNDHVDVTSDEFQVLVA